MNRGITDNPIGHEPDCHAASGPHEHNGSGYTQHSSASAEDGSRSLTPVKYKKILWWRLQLE